MIISASKLKTYSSCGQKYFYQYVEKRDRQDTIPLIMGSAIHKAIEAGYGGEDPMKIYTHEWHKKIANAGLEHNSKAFSKGMRMVLDYDFSIVPDFIELYFELPFPNAENPICTVNGYIDQGFGWGLRDLKSSARKPDQLLLDYDLQFILYGWAYEQITGEIPQAVIWHHLETQDDLTADVLGPIKLQHAVDSLSRLVEADRKQNFHRHIGFECGWCTFKDICLGGDKHNVGNS